MGYNIIDIIDKAIVIAYNRRDLYTKTSKETHRTLAVKILSKVLADNVNKTILFYEKLKKEVTNEEVEEIDFAIYDRVSFLINQFNSRMHITDATTTKEFLIFSLDFEKEILALFLDIQGRFVHNTNDTTSTTYLILSDMIKTKTNLINDLEFHN